MRAIPLKSSLRVQSLRSSELPEETWPPGWAHVSPRRAWLGGAPAKFSSVFGDSRDIPSLVETRLLTCRSSEGGSLERGPFSDRTPSSQVTQSSNELPRRHYYREPLPKISVVDRSIVPLGLSCSTRELLYRGPAYGWDLCCPLSAGCPSPSAPCLTTLYHRFRRCMGSLGRPY